MGINPQQRVEKPNCKVKDKLIAIKKRTSRCGFKPTRNQHFSSKRPKIATAVEGICEGFGDRFAASRCLIGYVRDIEALAGEVHYASDSSRATAQRASVGRS